MIIYGWNTKNIKQAQIDFHECPGCKEKQSVLTIQVSYAHIFWIPLFPYKKSLQIACATCGYAVKEDEVEATQRPVIKQLKSSISIPKYMFSGLILIAVSTGYFIFKGIQDDMDRKAWIENPQIGDVYVLKDNEVIDQYNHYLLKVNDIEGDSLLVSFNSYSYNDVVTTLDPKDGFYDVVYSMHKDDLKSYDEAEELKRVLRDYPASAGFDRVIEYVMPDSVYISE